MATKRGFYPIYLYIYFYICFIHLYTYIYINRIKTPFLSRKRAITTFLSQKFMITRSSIAFEDFLGSSIAPQVMPPCPLEVGFLLCAWRDSAPVLFSSLKSDQLGISLLKFLLSQAGWLELKSKSKRCGMKGSHFVCGCLWEDDGRKKRWCKEGKKWFEVARLSCLSPLGHSNRSWNTNQVFFPCLTRV